MPQHEPRVSEWIFFDCFNTLIDDFDEAGDESGLGSLPDLAVELGAFATRSAFIRTYEATADDEREQHREVRFDARLRITVGRGGLKTEAQAAHAAQALLARWHVEYPKSLRPTPGAVEMLEHWSTRARLAVVSNFFLPGYPLRYLADFGLNDRLAFVIDSAALGHRKPGRKIFDAALQRAGCLPQAVTFIGDRIDLDVEPSRALGMTAIHFNRTLDRKNAIATPPSVHAIKSWTEFR
jgi:HAD superfamily hydrolase (TIGR01509 family)